MVTEDCFLNPIETGDLIIIADSQIVPAFFIQNRASFQYLPILKWVADCILKGGKPHVSYRKYFYYKIMKIDKEHFEKNYMYDLDFLENYKIINNYVNQRYLL